MTNAAQAEVRSRISISFPPENMLSNNHRHVANGRHVDRAKIDLREGAEARRSEAIESVKDDLRDAVAKLMAGRHPEAVRYEAERAEAERDGLVALLRAVSSVVERLDRHETLITELHQLAMDETPKKEWYGVGEVAAILGKAEFTVREWCRLGRVKAAKRDCGRGNSQEWIVSHAELLRIQNEGLLPE